MSTTPQTDAFAANCSVGRDGKVRDNFKRKDILAFARRLEISLIAAQERIEAHEARIKKVETMPKMKPFK